jgi:hypothetical protein
MYETIQQKYFFLNVEDLTVSLLFLEQLSYVEKRVLCVIKIDNEFLMYVIMP